jgi:WD40 repeat protein
MLASGSADGNIYLWELPAGSIQHILSGHNGAIRSLAFTPDGGILFSGSSDGTVRMWRVSTGESLGTLRLRGIVNSLSISPNGALLAIGSEDGILQLWGITP